MAVGDNVDARIAYERLYQAQNKISLARAQFFPYGVGDVAAIYYTSSFSALILVELATSLPMKWYNVQKERHLRNAEEWNLKALRENIKNQTALLYYNILKEESMLALTSYELNLMEELFSSKRAEVDFGLITEKELEDLKFRILNLRDEYLRFEGYLFEEKAAMKMLLNLPYYSELRLQPVSKLLSSKDYNINTEALARATQENAFEVKSAEEVVNAAFDARRSTSWSILSFSGIGFGYLANVRMQRSKVREAQYRLEAVKNNVYNNVYTKVGMFQNSVDYFLSTKMISDSTERFMRGQLEVFRMGELPVSKLIETELYFLRDYREMLQAHYNAYVRYDDVGRIAPLDVSKASSDNENLDVKLKYSTFSYYFSLVDNGFDMSNIESVTYHFENQGMAWVRSFRSQSEFYVKVSKRKIRFPVDMNIEVLMKDGEVLNKKLRVTK